MSPRPFSSNPVRTSASRRRPSLTWPACPAASASRTRNCNHAFRDKEHGLLGCYAQYNRQEGVQGLLLRRRHSQGGIVGAQRQGEKDSKERYGLRQWQAILHWEPLQFAQLLLRGFLPLKAQCHPLQEINHRIQGRVLVIRR